MIFLRVSLPALSYLITEALCIPRRGANTSWRGCIEDFHRLMRIRREGRVA